MKNFKESFSFKKSAGFTLIELLVVIAIIGILAAVVLTSLNSAKTKGKTASAQSTVKSVASVMTTCMLSSPALAITLPNETNDGGGALICTGGAAYVSLPSGWIWCNASGTPQTDNNCGDDVSTQVTGTSFTIKAENTTDDLLISCFHTGECTVAGDTA